MNLQGPGSPGGQGFRQGETHALPYWAGRRRRDAAAATANAAPQARGAPGDIATWAPADKHGFATSHSIAGNAYLTLRQASASEIYYPDLSTPAFRGLQFAVVDKGTVTRETVDDDPDHIEPVAPGVTARVQPAAGSLAFTQTTETPRWRLTKTWITDPARAGEPIERPAIVACRHTGHDC